jgi:septum formation protein
MGKPHTPDRAQTMLTELRGCRHTVLTGVCALRSGTDSVALAVSRSAVKMRQYADDEIVRYVASGEPLDRAGAYAIQGGGGDLVEAVGGRVDTVIGLDVRLALQLLGDVGYPDPLPRPSDVSLTPPRVRRPLTPMRAPSRV